MQTFRPTKDQLTSDIEVFVTSNSSSDIVDITPSDVSLSSKWI